MLVFLVTTSYFHVFFRWFTLFGTVYTVPLLIPFRFMVVFGSSDEHPRTWTLKKGVPDGKRCATFFNPFRLQKHHPLLDVHGMFFFDDFDTLSFSDFHQIGSLFVSSRHFFASWEITAAGRLAETAVIRWQV